MEPAKRRKRAKITFLLTRTPCDTWNKGLGIKGLDLVMFSCSFALDGGVSLV